MTRLPRLRVLCTAVIALALSTMGSANAQEKVLRITGFGSGYQDGLRAAYFQPFEKATGIKIIEDTWNGEIGKIRAMVQAGKVTNDLFNGNPWDGVTGCDEGILEKIDKKFLGDLSDFTKDALSECAISTDIWTYMWAWDGDRQKFGPGGGPKTIADIFDTKKFPGKRGFPKRIYALVETALLADGVPADKVYEVLGSPGGLDRAFKKLDTIKKDIVWWTSNAQQPQLLADGQVDYVMINSSRYYRARVIDKKNFQPMWDGQIYSYDSWFIPKGAPNRDNAIKFLEFIMQPQILARITSEVSYPPTRKSAMQYVKAEMLPDLPTSHFTNAVFQDRVWWADRIDSYTKRFEAWLQQ
jgi:putative spermidine/putrescine transport system substrate-binding protein